MSWSLDEAFALFERQTNLERSDLGLTRAYRLERMVELLSRVGNPQQRLRVVHIAGSKGKGSTATIIAYLLAAAGGRVGLYTSPHILDYRERIRVLEQTDDEVQDCDLEAVLTACSKRTWELVAAKANEPGWTESPTTFELLTTLAFLAYEQTGCDWVVLETGLGGRLDATNVCIPQVCVITRIEREHTEYLGDTVAAIAGEKAGIIKSGVPVIVAPQTPDATQVIRSRAEAVGAPYIAIDPETLQLESRWDPHTGTTVSLMHEGQKIHATLPLVGTTQALNVAAALAAWQVLVDQGSLAQVSIQHVSHGLHQVRLTARGEVLRTNDGATLLVLDGAHTPQSVGALFRTIAGGGIRRCILLFAAAEGKDVGGIVRAVQECAPPLLIHQVLITRAGTFKRSEPTAFAHWQEAGYPTNRYATEAEALEAAIIAARGAVDSTTPWDCPVIVTGSFYLVAQIKRALAARERNRVPEPPRN